MDEGPRYWFAAKRYGWGWALPLAWQGWVVYGVWFCAFLAGIPYVLRGHLVGWLVFVLATTAIAFAICYWKGEPPRWRWGDREPEDPS